MFLSTEQMLDTFFILFFGTPLTLILSFWLVGRFIWLPMKEEYAKQKLEKRIIPYINRYTFNPEDPVTDCSGEIINSVIVVEDTDYGLVIMRYQDNIFEYWGDATPQYKTLEAVARKFVTSFRCEHLYIHTRYELHKKYIAKQKKEEKEEKEEKGGKENSIFAVFKKPASKANAKAKNNIITCDKSNIFKKRGRLSECDLFQYKKEQKSRTMDFSDWKKITFG